MIVTLLILASFSSYSNSQICSPVIAEMEYFSGGLIGKDGVLVEQTESRHAVDHLSGSGRLNKRGYLEVDIFSENSYASKIFRSSGIGAAWKLTAWQHAKKTIHVSEKSEFSCKIWCSDNGNSWRIISYKVFFSKRFRMFKKCALVCQKRSISQ